MLSDQEFNLILESTQPKESIVAWLDKMKIKNYRINDDLTVDVNGNVYLVGKELESIPIQFNIVGGSFDCSNNRLTTLEGAPRSVGGSFDCSNNQLTTLEGAPRNVGGGGFYCAHNQLTTLEGAPRNVGGSFWCPHNQLTTLEGAPRSVGGYFKCSNNQLTTLKGAPRSVGGYFECYDNQLRSYDGKPEIIKGKGFWIDKETYERIKYGDDKEESLEDIISQLGDKDEFGEENIINIYDELYGN